VASACSSFSAASSPGGSVIEVGPGKVGQMAPGFRLVDLKGNTVSLADYRGRPVIVNFWASWCIPCQQEFPLFVGARKAHADKGLEVLGVIYQDSPGDAQRFMNDHGASWPGLIDPAGKAASAYGVLGIPTSFYIDRSGRLQAISYGPPSQETLDGYLAKIL